MLVYVCVRVCVCGLLFVYACVHKVFEAARGLKPCSVPQPCSPLPGGYEGLLGYLHWSYSYRSQAPAF